MASHYEVLQVPRAASANAIRSAYLRRVLESHPDKGGTRKVGALRLDPPTAWCGPGLMPMNHKEFFATASKEARPHRASTNDEGCSHGLHVSRSYGQLGGKAVESSVASSTRYGVLSSRGSAYVTHPHSNGAVEIDAGGC